MSQPILPDLRLVIIWLLVICGALEVSGCERNFAGEITRTAGPAQDAAFATVHGTTGATSFAPAFDGNGNIVAWLEAATGAVSAAFDYDAFGNLLAAMPRPLSSAADAAAIPFGFSTKYRDAETGTLHYGLRDYSPPLGRWLSKDPIEEVGGVNLYGFVGNDGVNAVDALGLAAASTSFGVPYAEKLLAAFEAFEAAALNLLTGPSAVAAAGARVSGVGAAGSIAAYAALAAATASANEKIALCDLKLCEQLRALLDKLSGMVNAAIQEISLAQTQNDSQALQQAADALSMAADALDALASALALVCPSGDSLRAIQTAKTAREQSKRAHSLANQMNSSAGGNAAKGGMSLADEMAVLRQATTGKGNFGVGSASHADAMRLGNAWVGNGSRVASDGRTLVSADGLRTFRPPSAKPNSPYATTGVQANFETLERTFFNGVERFKVIRNGHLDITP